MQPESEPKDLERLGENPKKSLEKARELVDELTVVQEYENRILEDEPRLFNNEHD
jgi:hypothetical protein